MKITLAIDAACDLPRQVIDNYNVHVLPVSVSTDGHDIDDTRQPERTLQYYSEHLIDKYVYIGHQRRRRRFILQAPNPDACEASLWEALADTDYLIVLCGGKEQSYHYAVLETVVERLSARLRNAQRSTKVRLMDSHTWFAGQGLVAAQAIALIRRGEEGSELRRHINDTGEHTHNFMVPTDLTYLNERQQLFGLPPLRWTTGLLGTTPKDTPIICAHQNRTFTVDRQATFNAAAQAMFAQGLQVIHRGLHVPYVSLSYAGDLKDLDQFEAVQALRELHRSRAIVLLVSTMGLTGATCLGAGALSLALASAPNEWSVAA